MKELSLNILDISENSVKARATLVEITLSETDETLTVSVKDTELHHIGSHETAQCPGIFPASPAGSMQVRKLIRKHIPERPGSGLHAHLQIP